ncbi:hypothetical protein ACFL5T_01785 [Gemmatimonadota bacterium]
MYYGTDWLAAGNIAVFVLTFFGGLIISYVFTAKGVGGCGTYLVALAVLGVLLAALVLGSNQYFEWATWSLTDYIYREGITGVVGFFSGFLFGLITRFAFAWISRK